MILRWDKSGANEDFLEFKIAQYVGKTGAPGTIRTCDPQYRKLMLYPAELRVHFLEKFVCRFKRQTSLYMMPLTGMEVNFNLNIETLFTSCHSCELGEII